MNPFKIVLIFITLFLASDVNAQFFKKLQKRATRAAEETVLRKAENETAEITNEVLDSVFKAPDNAPNESPNADQRERNSDNSTNQRGNSPQSQDSKNGNTNVTDNPPEEKATFSVYTKFDFVPGEKILVFDDFSEDHFGDFPAKWDTNGSGEIVSFDDNPQKWFAFVNKSIYIPDHDALPEEFTMEFDIASRNLTRKTSSNAKMEIQFVEESGFNTSKTRSTIAIPFCQYSPIGFTVQKYTAGKRDFYNVVEKDIREDVMEVAHISVAVNKTRVRLWVNEKKVVDIPRLLNNSVPRHVQFTSYYFNDTEENMYFTNLKIAEGGLDLRSKLMKDGKFSTTGILFDSGSATIKPESFGTLKMIANVLQEENANMRIVGHTDSDGSSESNLKLSEQRAKAVRQILVEQFGINESLLSTEGKGETQPVADNTSTEGKAQNRRVEFIKI